MVAQKKGTDQKRRLRKCLCVCVYERQKESERGRKGRKVTDGAKVGRRRIVAHRRESDQPMQFSQRPNQLLFISTGKSNLLRVHVQIHKRVYAYVYGREANDLYCSSEEALGAHANEFNLAHHLMLALHHQPIPLPPIYLSIYLFTCLSIHLTIYLSVILYYNFLTASILSTFFRVISV